MSGLRTVVPALVLAVAVFPPAALAGDRPIAIVGGTVIDGNGGAPIENGVVVIGDDLILAVGTSADMEVPDDAEVIDASGQSVMPGLADMHIHLLGGWDGVSVDMLGYRRYLNAMLYAGVTTVLDTGNVMPYILQLRSATESGALDGPRIFAVGPLVEGADPYWPPISHIMTSASQAPAIVAQLNRAGVDAVKAYQGLSVPQLQALVLAAGELDLPVIADLWARSFTYDVVATGVAALAHLPSRILEAPTLELLQANDVAVITTLAVKESFAEHRLQDLSFLEHPLIANTNPPQLSSALRDYAGATPTERRLQFREQYRRALAISKATARRLHEAGVMLVAGTDAPYPGTLYGEGLHRELELLVDSGLTPLQAIGTATKNAAALMLADDWGTIDPGKRADLLIVEGRPDRNIGDTRNVRVVIQAGRVVDRDALTFDESDGPVFAPGNPVDSAN